MEESSPFISCISSAYVRENPHPKLAENKVLSYLHFRVPEIIGDW